MGEESVIGHAAYAQPYSSRSAYCGASPGNMQRTRTSALSHFDNAVVEMGVISAETVAKVSATNWRRRC